MTLPQIIQIVGISGIISALVTFILNRIKYKKEKQVEFEERRLEYSFTNYPNFAAVLQNIIKVSREARNLSEDKTKFKKFEETIFTLLYYMGEIYQFEQRFRKDQGQLFRLCNYDSEILARFLYDLGKEALGMTSSRLGLSSSRLNMQDEQYLIQAVDNAESLEKFIQNAQDDQIIKRIQNQILNGVIPSRAQEWAEKNFGTLSRFLIKEIQSIKLPGYLRDPNPLSYPDNLYIETTKRIATVFISRNSLNTFKEPLKIWIYNHWTEEIDIAETTQFCIYSQNAESSIPDPDWERVELDIVDPVTKVIKKKLNAGETGMVEWNRKKRDGHDAKSGWYQLTYLPDTEDKAGTTSAYSIDYYMKRDKDKTKGFQYWQLRSSLQ